MYGYVPPSATDLEMAVLGSVMLEAGAFDPVSDILTEDCFYTDAHQRIFRSISGLHNRNAPVNILTVVEDLRQRGDLETVGGLYYVTKLTNDVVSSASNIEYCRIIKQKHIRREVIRHCSDILTSAYDDTIDEFDLLDEAETRIFNINQETAASEMKSQAQVMKETAEMIEGFCASGGGITGIPSGFSKIDRATRGWQPGDLIIFAARPSVGKTSCALQIIQHAVRNTLRPTKVAVFSLEMKAARLGLRMVSAHSEIYLHKLQTGNLSPEEKEKLYRDTLGPLSRDPIFWDDGVMLNIARLRSKCRRLKAKQGIGLIVIDYLQLMSGRGDERNREQEIAKISRGLKALAMELQIPIIALSQMSREIEKRQGKKREPLLSDLRESGAIEQDADLVLALWGPEEEDIEQDASLLNARWMRILKNRDGMLIKAKLEFKNETQHWCDAPDDKIEQKGHPALPVGNWRGIENCRDPTTSHKKETEDDNPF